MKVRCDFCTEDVDIKDLKIGINGQGHPDCVIKEIKAFSKQARG